MYSDSLWAPYFFYLTNLLNLFYSSIFKISSSHVGVASHSGHRGVLRVRDFVRLYFPDLIAVLLDGAI